MTEYDKKVKELNELINWFDEHADAKEVTREDDAFVIICPSDNDDEKMHTFALGDTSLLKGYLINILNDVEMETWE